METKVLDKKVREYLRKNSAKGGKQRTKNLTKEQLSAIGRKGALAQKRAAKAAIAAAEELLAASKKALTLLRTCSYATRFEDIPSGEWPEIAELEQAIAKAEGGAVEK